MLTMDRLLNATALEWLAIFGGMAAVFAGFTLLSWLDRRSRAQYEPPRQPDNPRAMRDVTPK